MTSISLSEFLSTVPHQLAADLIHLSPYISAIKRVVEIVSWNCNSWYDSWLAIAGWWALCLLAEPGLRYFLPLAAFFVWSMPDTTSSHSSTPITESSVQTTLSEISTLRSLLPHSARIPTVPLTPERLPRIVASVYIPYLVFTYLIPLRVILGVSGTILLSWRAPWAIYLRGELWRNAYVRWAVYRAWSRISGNPLRPMSLPPGTSSIVPEKVNSLRFVFDVYENQRWWVGLDWTAALLPNERPSWCSSSHQPTSPPNVFTLPGDSVAYLADPKGGRLRHTASWSWEESEWKVLVRKDGAGPSRVEKPLPTIKEENPSILTKAAGKMKEASTHDSDKGEDDIDTEQTDEEVTTDADGWVYADNKWEGRSSKGGIGKYTRYRRWTRVAVVTETIEHTEDGEPGVNTIDNELPDSTPQPPDSPNSEKSPLRYRLKNVLTKMESPSS